MFHFVKRTNEIEFETIPFLCPALLRPGHISLALTFYLTFVVLFGRFVNIARLWRIVARPRSLRYVRSQIHFDAAIAGALYCYHYYVDRVFGDLMGNETRVCLSQLSTGRCRRLYGRKMMAKMIMVVVWVLRAQHQPTIICHYFVSLWVAISRHK